MFDMPAVHTAGLAVPDMPDLQAAAVARFGLLAARSAGKLRSDPYHNKTRGKTIRQIFHATWASHNYIPPNYFSVLFAV